MIGSAQTSNATFLLTYKTHHYKRYIVISLTRGPPCTAKPRRDLCVVR